MKSEEFGTELGDQLIFVNGELNGLLFDLKEAINEKILANTSLKGKTFENSFPIAYSSLEESFEEIKGEIASMLRENA